MALVLEDELDRRGRAGNSELAATAREALVLLSTQTFRSLKSRQ